MEYCDGETYQINCLNHGIFNNKYDKNGKSIESWGPNHSFLFLDIGDELMGWQPNIPEEYLK